MKKSQLKNLIRESIKELSEQTTQQPADSTTNPGFMEVRLRTCNGTMQTPICLNSQAGYEIGHQFKHYDVMNNVRTSFIEDILGIGWCFNSTLGNPGGAGLTGEPSMQSDILEDPYVGACEANPNSTFVAEPDDSVVSPTDPNPDYDPVDASTLDFPQGFEPSEWAQGWVTNLSQYMEEDMSGVCNFITERIELWTSQYQTAGPLYQNQLVYKIQLGYFILQYLPCDGSAGLPMLSEQKAMKALPSKLTSFLKNLAKKTASNLIKSLEQKSRMKKLANIKPPRKR